MKIKGLTLIETLVAVSIFVALILVIFTVMETGRNAWFTEDVSTELRQGIINAFSVMERELRETGNNSPVINLPSGTSANSLTFHLPQKDANGDIILDANGNVTWSLDTITYALNGAGQITRTTQGSTTILANNIIYLQFRRPASRDELSMDKSTLLDNVMQITVAARKTNALRRVIDDSGQITIEMRN
ncbi:MAG: hypothetical protein FJZ15_02320 [Candidatus Omnitrophica bacterium]|nr:hypothetical protein [Candidatus Omnitrophota bacterium]